MQFNKEKVLIGCIIQIKLIQWQMLLKRVLKTKNFTLTQTNNNVDNHALVK